MSVNIYNSNPNATSEEENFSRVADRGSKLASDTIYNNTTSGLNSVNVQGAIDEVNEKVDDNVEAISQINNDLSDGTFSNLSTTSSTIIQLTTVGSTSATITHNGLIIIIARYPANISNVQIKLSINGIVVFIDQRRNLSGSIDIRQSYFVRQGDVVTLEVGGQAIPDAYVLLHQSN